jgi:CRISPR system Cascade subunit CasA
LDRAPANHWNLFHPTEPLGQNALLAPYLDKHGTGPAQLVLEHVGDYNQFFDHHHLEHPTPLSVDAAFRAMLTQHAYGPSGRARISGKETLGPTLTNLTTGRLVGRVRVFALGDSLGDTLRLNMVPEDALPSNGPTSDRFNRTWTVSPQPRRGFKTKPLGRSVDGPVDLNTVLGRSILMRPATDTDGQLTVDRVLMAAGEVLEPLPPALMSDAVHITGAQGKRKPLWPSPFRALWREAHALYAAVADRDRPQDLYDRIARVQPRLLHLWTVGLITKQSTAHTWVSDAFPFIPGREQELRHAATRASVLAEHVAKSLYKASYSAWRVAYPNPKPSDKKQQMARFDAQPEHWAHAAEPFHVLLDEAAQTKDAERIQEVVQVYAMTLAQSAERFLKHRLDSLPANGRGFKARQKALETLARELARDPAPEELGGDFR